MGEETKNALIVSHWGNGESNATENAVWHDLENDRIEFEEQIRVW